MKEKTVSISGKCRKLHSYNDILKAVCKLKNDDELCFQRIVDDYGWGVTIKKAFHEKIMVFVDGEEGTGHPLVLPSDYKSPGSGLVDECLSEYLGYPENKDLQEFFHISRRELEEGLDAEPVEL